MAAVVAHNDIPFIVGNSAQGVLWPVGVTAYGGRKATDAWERALDGKLLAPSVPERRLV
jgi:hypothetical protein